MPTRTDGKDHSLTGSRIDPTALIGEPPEHRDWRPGQRIFWPAIDQTARINAYVTIDAGMNAPTQIGPRVFLMKHVHVGHDAKIGADCELAPGTVIGGHAVLEAGVRCGINVSVKPFVRVGEGARLGMGAVVVRDVPAGEVWAGNPARPLGPRRPSEISDAERDGWNEWYAAGHAERPA